MTIELKDWTTAWDLDVYEMLPANVTEQLRRMFGLIATRRLGEVALVVNGDALWCEDCESVMLTVKVIADIRESLHDVEWDETAGGDSYCMGCASTLWAVSEEQWAGGWV